MKIEQVSDKDIAEIKELARRAILESVKAEDSVKTDVIADTETHIEVNLKKGGCSFLKCVDDKILGFILIQEYWNLSDLYVLPDVHRKGIGKILVAGALSDCFKNGNRDYIRVNSSLNAEGFYRRLGFKSVTPEKEVPSFVVPLIFRF